MKKRKVLWRVGLGLVLGGILLSGGRDIQATTYEIGGGAADYDTLEELRDANKLVSGDEIVLYQDDYSLTKHLTYQENIGATDQGLIFRSDVAGVLRTVTPASNFTPPVMGGALESGADGTVSIQGIAFKGFEAVGATSTTGIGGVIYSKIPISISGSASFIKNTASATGNSGQAQGGAIYTDDQLSITNGTFLFQDNSATKEGSGDGGDGGAIYAKGKITMDEGSYTFSGNSASGANGGMGGAINSYGKDGIEMNSGTYSFDKNKALGGAGRGGAISVSGDSGESPVLTMNGGIYSFTNNKASGSADNTGAGGAISTNKLKMDGGTYTFDSNSVTGGDWNNSNLGGAIYIHGYSIIGGSNMGAGTYSFTDNRVAGGAGYANARGGAIYLQDSLTTAGGTYQFIGNTASGGTGTASGLGGAIYSSRMDSTLSGNLLFQNNRAESANPDDPTSGRGGAIFWDKYGPAATSRNLTLMTNTGESIIFQGNTQQSGANSIYFGNTSLNYDSTFTIDTAPGTTIAMYDPIQSQKDDLRYNDITYGNVNLTVKKTGLGQWLLGGTSNLDSAATVAIEKGMLTLERDAELNLNHAETGTFSVAGGATFNPTVFGTNMYSKIKAIDVDVEQGAKLKVSGISSLAPGDAMFLNAIVADSASIPQDFVYTPDTTASLRLYEEARYIPNATNDNQNLVIRGVKNMSDVFGTRPFWDSYRRMDLSQDKRDIFDAIYQTGNDLIPPEWKRKGFILDGGGVLNAADARRVNADMFSRVMFDHILDHQAPGRHNHRRNIGNYENDPYDSYVVVRGQSADSACGPACLSAYGNSGNGCGSCGGRDLWGVFSQNWTDLNDSDTLYGYEYRPYALSFGSDRQFGCWTVGLAAQYAHGTVKSGDVDYTHTTMDAATLGVYAGRFWERYYLIGNMQFGAGWNKESTYVAPSELIDGTYNTGSYNSATLGTSMEFGRTFRFGCNSHPYEITPHVGTDYYFINSEAFTESGGPMIRSFGSVNYNVVEIPFGVRMAKYFRAKGGRLDWCRPSVDVMYVRSVADDVPVTTVSMTGLAMPVPAWDAPGMNVGRDIFRMSAGVMGRYCDCVDVGLSYDLDARNNYTSQQLNAGITWNR